MDLTRQLPSGLVLAGFALVDLSTIGWMSGFVFESSYEFQEIVTMIGFVVLALASAALLHALSRATAHLPGIRLVLRLFAAGYLLMGVAYLSSIHYLAEFHRETHSLHFALRDLVVSNALSLLGFCVVAAGFWLAARNIKRPADNSGSPEPALPLERV
jgi:hypothetical protein